jgi:hypothetical protein
METRTEEHSRVREELSCSRAELLRPIERGMIPQRLHAQFETSGKTYGKVWRRKQPVVFDYARREKYRIEDYVLRYLTTLSLEILSTLTLSFSCRLKEPL